MTWKSLFLTVIILILGTSCAVHFEAESRIIPPDPEHTFPPGPFLPGCTYVIIDQEGRRELGNKECADIME